MSNPFALFKSLLPDAAVAVGKVLSIAGGVAVVELPGGQVVPARGVGTVGQMVFVRAGLIESTAPSLSVVTVTV